MKKIVIFMMLGVVSINAMESFSLFNFPPSSPRLGPRTPKKEPPSFSLFPPPQSQTLFPQNERVPPQNPEIVFNTNYYYGNQQTVNNNFESLVSDEYQRIIGVIGELINATNTSDVVKITTACTTLDAFLPLLRKRQSQEIFDNLCSFQCPSSGVIEAKNIISKKCPSVTCIKNPIVLKENEKPLDQLIDEILKAHERNDLNSKQQYLNAFKTKWSELNAEGKQRFFERTFMNLRIDLQYLEIASILSMFSPGELNGSIVFWAHQITKNVQLAYLLKKITARTLQDEIEKYFWMGLDEMNKQLINYTPSIEISTFLSDLQNALDIAP